MKAVNRNILSHVKRNLSAQAARKTTEASSSAQPAKVSQLPNGAVVASVENYSPITRLSVIYKAGARYEHHHALGASHCIRIASNLSTKNCSSFGLVKNIQQIGGVFGCSTSRDHMIYNMEFLRGHVDVGAEFLGHASTGPAFKHWEVHDVQPRLNVDLAVLNEQPVTQLIEHLHTAAYKSGLGRSLFAPSFMVGHYSPEMLQDFVSHNFTSGRMAIVGVGVDHDVLVERAKEFYTPVAGGGSSAEKTKYRGGEARIDTISEFAHVALVSEGAALNTKEALALGVVQQALGCGQHIKYGSNTASSKLNQAAVAVTNNPISASCFNVNYSDSGLFGFIVSGQGEDMGKVLPALVAQMRAVSKSGIDEADITRGKNQLKANLHMSIETGTGLVEEMAVQAITTGKITTIEEISQAIDSLTSTDINNIAKKVITGKASMAAIGDLATTPFLDELV
ncbi:cytochrome b-c1 complex subunit 2, mitochondrial-like [Tubulanus polymorphus]|uniref:cytochrome b-c1 complex subunit 2, mitochondrial-like n=1 Tax=Tubulanus polymorphus TaxID=672921 RepID=UPI003DA35DEE